LDTAQGPASPGADRPSTDAPPPGLRAQVRRLREAIRRLLAAHLDLARAEAAEIGAEIGRVALLAGIALGALFLLGLLLPIGLALFLGEWLLGSIGWGVLLGSVALVDLALVAALVGLGVPGGVLGRDLLLASLTGTVAFFLLVAFLTGPRVGVALGLFIVLVGWPMLAGIGVARRGIDTTSLKARFYPTQTIETAKETIEWVRERTPLGRKS